MRRMVKTKTEVGGFSLRGSCSGCCEFEARLPPAPGKWLVVVFSLLVSWRRLEPGLCKCNMLDLLLPVTN
uniref:Uncharacterized protein n=1 Tax=Helianthus annuus TaxID=4232 RepID=A0A251VIA1_HELAN